MRITFLFLLFASSSFVYSQEGLQLGVEVSPAWNLNTHRSKATGIRSSESGYGFNVGIPLKWWYAENMAFHSGLNFEYMAFDNRVNNTLIGSNRYGSIHLPLFLNYKLSGGWVALFGGGINYQFFNQAWSGFGVDISSQINQFQPYLGAGVSTLMERDNGVFEFGAQARYHFLELWAPGTPTVDDFTSKILSLDLILRYYLWNR
ncbi:MAG: hypothetical protein WDZ35_07035 [Crocinitomicaceae bacterium]